MKTILITGSTDGIGKQTALELAGKGHHIILHGRNKVRGLLVREDLIKQTGNEQIHYFNGDFSDFESIREFAGEIRDRFSHLDVLLNNAGVLLQQREVLPNGFERTFMVNHLAYFYLTFQLLDLVKAAEEGRIVNVSSQAQSGSIDFNNLNGEKRYDAYNAYTLSKLENVLFTYKLSRELKDTNISVHALHPGVIATKLLRAGWGGGGAPVETGARTTVYVAVSEDLKGKTGLYFVNARESRSSAISYDQRVQERLWQLSLEYCGMEDPFKR